MKPMKQCNKVTCRILIPFDQQYCAQHNHLKRERHHTYDFVRNREDKKYRDIYHTSRWRKLRDQVMLRDDYLCRVCLSNGLYTVAEEVDHIIELRDNIDKAFDMDNLQAICRSCHRQKTLEKRAKRQNRN